MSLGTEVAAHIPLLRRFARALTGSQGAGDALVRAVLEAALTDPALAGSLRGGRVPLYRAFCQVWAAASREISGWPQAASGQEAAVQQHLNAITPPERQALLLTAVEEFTAAEAAQIMDLTEDDVQALVRQAVADIASESVTSILIIEDEPLIAMQLEALVIALGHSVCGMAATRGQVLDVIAQHQPGLVLADIQLADGSSGIDAVADILAIAPVPVIFITAFPERLLTGELTEPTYLITKPFQEDAVRAAMAQALFFSGALPPA
jgi:DNA-directed RNA polymerase specialized sigma24 family protein